MIDCSTGGGFTVNPVEPLTLPKVAVMVVWPGPTANAEPKLSITATLSSDEVQATVKVRSCVVPSL